MKIASATLEMQSTHASFQQHQIRESMRAWTGGERPDFEARSPVFPPPADSVDISPEAQAAQSSEADAINAASEAIDKDPMLMMLRALIRELTGREAQVFDPGELEQAQGKAHELAEQLPSANADSRSRQGWGVEYERHESYTEAESTSFSAAGTIRTADGREISFSVDLRMERRYHEASNTRLLLGDAARPKKDPLVLNFNGTAAQLQDQRISFDLDADGSSEEIARLASGSLYLALDRNADGRINDGSELFGTRSGNGFADLSGHDDDGNGWIDENDRAFTDLRLWDGGDGPLLTLAEAGVGALHLGNVATPFSLRGGGNSDLGAVRSSGVFLRESGEAGTMQQIDLSV